VEEEAIRSNLAFWKKRDRRCLSNNRYFHRVRRGDIVGHVVNDLDPATLNKLLSDPDAPFRQRGVSLLKDSRSSTVADLKYTIDGVQRRLIYKRFRVRTLLESLASVLRPTHATKSWKLGHELCTRCLSTARPLLVLHRTRRGFQRDGYLLTERVENALDLHQFVGSLGQLGSDAARHRLRLGLSAVARAIRQLHGCQMSHRDLKATNLFLENDLKDKSAPLRQVQPAPSGAALPSYLPLPASPVWFIDLAGARLHSRLSRKRRVKDLARLNTSFHQSPALTRTDKLRFLRSYLLWNLVGRGDWKNWWKAIAQATARKVDRNIRRGRVLT
jgi:hypothetical protein